MPGSQIVQWERIKTSKAKIRLARLGKGGGGGGKNGREPVSPPPCLSPALARFSHFLLLNDFPPPSRSLEQATLSQTQMTDFPTLSYNSMSKIPTLSYT